MQIFLSLSLSLKPAAEKGKDILCYLRSTLFKPLFIFSTTFPSLLKNPDLPPLPKTLKTLPPSFLKLFNGTNSGQWHVLWSQIPTPPLTSSRAIKKTKRDAARSNYGAIIIAVSSYSGTHVWSFSLYLLISEKC